MSSNQLTTVFQVVVITVLFVAGLLLLEYRKMKTGKPIITESLRAAVQRLPWIWILLALITGFMMGHCFGN